MDVSGPGAPVEVIYPVFVSAVATRLSFPMQLRFASLAAVFSLLACSSSGDSNPITAPDDTGEASETSTEDSASPEDSSTGEDTGTATDSTVDSATGETAGDTAPADVSTTCAEAGAVESQDCGKCGKRARLCNSDGKWLPWGACTGEKGMCTPAETRMTACGKCGKRAETCSATCGWEPGACTGEGLCNAGDVEVQYGACPIAKQVKTRTCNDTCGWSDWSGCVAPKGWNDIAAAPSTFYGRQYHSAVWTGTEMVIFGGYSSSGGYMADAAAYNPTTDVWRTLPASGITGRQYSTAVWTGTQMLVFGGYSTSLPYSRNDGAAWDAASNTWSPIPAPTSPTVTARYSHSAVWTGSEMIVWGGYLASPGTYLADGAAYNPTTKVWRTIAASPLAGRYDHGAVFAGGKMIVFGGRGTSCPGSTSGCSDAAAYDPVANSWTSLTPPSADLDGRYGPGSIVDSTGKQAIFWGGYGAYVSPSYTRNTGAIFDTTTSTWKSITPPTDTVFPSSKRWLTSMWTTSTALYVWGGSTSSTSGTTANGAYYEFATSTWKAMTDTNAPTARNGAVTVWTGNEAIVWGGYSYKNDGKIYRP